MNAARRTVELLRETADALDALPEALRRPGGLLFQFSLSSGAMRLEADHIDEVVRALTDDVVEAEIVDDDVEPLAFGARVLEAGGGQVVLLVDRDTSYYPDDNQRVRVVAERTPRPDPSGTSS